jgi:hypothetical protein
MFGGGRHGGLNGITVYGLGAWKDFSWQVSGPEALFDWQDGRSPDLLSTNSN